MDFVLSHSAGTNEGLNTQRMADRDNRMIFIMRRFPKIFNQYEELRG